MKIIRAHRLIVPLVTGMTVALPAGALAAAPSIRPMASLQSQAVILDKTASFSVTASGTQPLFYQWRFNGENLTGQTDRTLTIAAVQPADEGNYSVAVSNNEGLASSEPFRLFVVPRPSEFRKGNFTNSAGFRLPYVYRIPAEYRSDHAYPLVCHFHGIGAGGWTEKTLPEGFADWPQVLTLASYGRQATDPAIVLWPTRHVGTEANLWTSTELGATLELLDQLISEFNIDTNRIYLGGASGGGAPVVNALGIRTNFFAAAATWSGIAGQTSAQRFKHVPVWVFVSAAEGLAGDARSLVRNLRAAGGHPVFTEYAVGTHDDAIRAGMACPAMAVWLLAQHRGQTGWSSPSITIPTDEAIRKTGANAIELAGSAEGYRGDVAGVTWENTTTRIKGTASGTNLWTANAIPLVSNKTNVVVVTGTMNTTWAPAYGGSTTFNDTLSVICSPVRVTMAVQGTDAILNWSGGVPPFHVQRRTEITAADWLTFLMNAVPPLRVPLQRPAEFYRIAGQ
ncbi:MAG: immunoglobulin domain-containing protein [Acidobacteria bacterium]|nr:immunoglobulin domain-containing protein [Acidobacteriota bacterium]